MRRLFVLLRALPSDSEFKAEVHAAYERSLIPTEDKIRARQEYHRQREAAS